MQLSDWYNNMYLKSYRKLYPENILDYHISHTPHTSAHKNTSGESMAIKILRDRGLESPLKEQVESFMPEPGRQTRTLGEISFDVNMAPSTNRVAYNYENKLWKYVYE